MAARLTAVLVAAIVGVTLVAGLIVGAQREDDSGPIDLLIYNGRVFTGDVATPFAEAIAVRGNRIYRVGSNRDIKRLRRRATTVVDAHGGSVLPAFSDAQTTLPAFASEPPAPAPPDEGTPAAAREGESDAAIREAVAGVHRLGMTTIGVTLEGPGALEEFERLRQRHDGIDLRIVATIQVAAPLDEAFFSRLETLRLAPDADPMVRVDGVAIDVMLPADAQAKKAAARQRTRTAANAVVRPALSNDDQRLVLALDRRGLPLVLRVDDERELAAALDALERAAADNPAPASGRRHRLALAHPMAFDVDRVKALGATVSLPLPSEPAERADASPDAPAAELAAWSPGLREGIRVVMVSEALADPRLGLQALVGAQSADREPASEAAVDASVLSAALRTLTADAAAAQGDERTRGTIARDKVADLIVLSADLFSLPPDKLLDAVVMLTILDGKIVFDREAETPAATEP
jgi:predicted amidohydrolase YtcJ